MVSFSRQAIATFTALAFVQPTYASVDGELEPDKWGYAQSSGCAATPQSKCGPNEWDKVAAACKEQGTESPIDLVTSDATVMPFNQAPLNLTSKECNAVVYELNPHTVQVNFGETCPDAYNITFGGETYTLVQFHFHSPSEHTLNGEYFPMEAHYVHTAPSGKALVLGTFIGSSEKAPSEPPASFLHGIMDNTPKPDGRHDNDWNDEAPFKSVTSQAEFPWDAYIDFVPKSIKESFYTYLGSMTTPACNTGVTWVMSPKPAYVAADTILKYRQIINGNPANQLATFGKIMGSAADPTFSTLAGPISWDGSLGCNCRPIQPLHGAQGTSRKLVQVGATPFLADTGSSPLPEWVIALVILVAAAFGIVIYLKFCRTAPTSAREPLMAEESRTACDSLGPQGRNETSVP